MPTRENLRNAGIVVTVKGPHVMFDDERTRVRIVDYWPSTRRWRNPHDGTTGQANREGMLDLANALRGTIAFAEAVKARRPGEMSVGGRLVHGDWRRRARFLKNATRAKQRNKRGR